MLRDHVIVPVWREVLADALTPVGAFLRLDPRPNGFLLESVEGGERWARYSFIGGDAFGVVTAKDGRVSLDGIAPVAPTEGESPLAYVGRLLEACRAPALEGLPPLHGGAVGFLGYDCVRELERLPDAPDDDLGLPDLALLLTRTFVVFDHLMQKAFAITNVMRTPDADADDLYDDAMARCDEVVEAFSAPLASPAAELDFDETADAGSTVDDPTYEAWVETAREHIYAGDVFQVVP